MYLLNRGNGANTAVLYTDKCGIKNKRMKLPVKAVKRNYTTFRTTETWLSQTDPIQQQLFNQCCFYREESSSELAHGLAI